MWADSAADYPNAILYRISTNNGETFDNVLSNISPAEKLVFPFSPAIACLNSPYLKQEDVPMGIRRHKITDYLSL
ncbi:MAG: hypothetical protein WBX01_04655 [Nitrososphaeraceae archaeon]